MKVAMTGRLAASQIASTTTLSRACIDTTTDTLKLAPPRLSLAHTRTRAHIHACVHSNQAEKREHVEQKSTLSETATLKQSMQVVV
eukprot:5344711-Pleurochrysis_carterae.AAC.2